jgi:hypothetical protein
VRKGGNSGKESRKKEKKTKKKKQTNKQIIHSIEPAYLHVQLVLDAVDVCLIGDGARKLRLHKCSQSVVMRTKEQKCSQRRRTTDGKKNNRREEEVEEEEVG